jgi:hypothetical protein
MSSEPFSISLIVERLHTDAVPAELSRHHRRIQPGDGVVRFCGPRGVCADGAGARCPGNGSRAQVAEAVFGVAVAVRNYGQGADGLTHEISPLIGQIRDQLIGWVPGSCHHRYPVAQGRHSGL